MRPFRLLTAGLVLLAASSAPAQPAGTADRLHQAFNLAYNLDHDEAVVQIRQAAAADPTNPAPPRALATVIWLNLLFKRGVVLVENYLGTVSKSDVTLDSPPADIAAAFRTHLDRAVALAEARLARAPDDPAALYELGTALGLQASWSATIEGRVLGAFGAARRAYNANERVLSLAPSHHEAGLIVGTYRYLVASLVLPARWIAYMAGFGGGKERGLALIEEVARRPNLAQTDAKFALVLLYNRERAWDRALGYLAELRRDYPRNRLVWLETGATFLRADRPAEAERVLSEGIQRLSRDARPRMGGEEGQWYYKRGVARVLLKKPAEATADLTESLRRPLPDWLRGRVHLELGKAADLAGNRTRAIAEYERCVQLSAAAKDSAAEAAARRLRSSGYKG